MLKGIPAVISPELMKTMMEMGHGDELVLADANFPAVRHAQRLVRSDCGIPELLDAILHVFPLDSFVRHSTFLMKRVKGDDYKPFIWDTYKEVIRKHEPNFREAAMLERFVFYNQASKAFAVVATAETARYANIILKKGIVEM
jgi:L-fucose mutarotase